jgi:hypothetical protein
MNNGRRKQQKIVFTESLIVQKQRLDRPIFKALVIKIKNCKLDLESLGRLFQNQTQRLGACGGQISPESTRRLKDLAKGLRPNKFARSSLRGPGEERLIRRIDTRLDQRKPRRPDEFERRPQQ